MLHAIAGVRGLRYGIINFIGGKMTITSII
jgi:hypothetical protein